MYEGNDEIVETIITILARQLADFKKEFSDL